MNLSSVWSAGAYGSRPGGAQGHAAGAVSSLAGRCWLQRGSGELIDEVAA
jgi:hypothetical protein